jgi:acyl-CoA synthetase (AMP-forming)/AMP-acid ligase II
MAQNTVALPISPAPVVSIFRLIDRLAQKRPTAPALGPLTALDLREACLHLREAGDLARVLTSDPLIAIPQTLGNLTNGAVTFSDGAAPLHWRPGEFLLPDRSRGPAPDHIRLPQDRLLTSAKALATRYGFTDQDRLHVEGRFDDPGTWLALTAALCAGTPITLTPEDATIVWNLAAVPLSLPDKARIVHFRATPAILAGFRDRYPDITVVNGLASATGGGLPICSDPRDPPETVLTTLGRPLGDTEVMIVDPDTGMDLLLYETGEVWLRRGSTMVGYASGHKALAEAGFLTTGLFGHLDSEGRLVLDNGRGSAP